jgi:hypothetical protein
MILYESGSVSIGMNLHDALRERFGEHRYESS